MLKSKLSLTLIICLVTFDFCNPQQIIFKHLSEENGLSDRVVNCTIEDHIGFLWFGTEDGLNRFDGYNFRVFRNIPGDSTTLSDNNIWSLYADSEGNIWVGTQNGILNCFDPVSEKFKRFNITLDNSLQGNSITCIYRDKNDLLWLGTYKGGLYRMDIKTGNVLNYQNHPGDGSSLSNKFVTSVYEDSEGNIWVGTYNGLCLLKNNSGNGYFIRFYNNPADENSISNNIIWKIFPSESDYNHLWICTYNGITYLNTRTKHFTRVIPDQKNPDKFSRSISSVSEDFSDVGKYMWIGTYEGLLRLDLPEDFNSDRRMINMSDSVLAASKYNLKFKRWINKSGNQFSINNNHINNILMDRAGVLWISGQDGIDYYAPRKDKFNLLSFYNILSDDLERNDIKNVQTICETGAKIVWMGTNSGIYKLDNVKTHCELYRLSDFSNQNIWTMASGNNSDLWIGTYGNGLEHLELNTGKIKRWKGNWFDSTDISNSYVRSVYQDESGSVWVGMWGVGLNRLNPATGEIKRWHHENKDPRSLSYDDIWVIYGDSKGRVWVGTYGGGLNLFNPDDGGTFYKWGFNPGTTNGLNSNNILSIEESSLYNSENKTILWIGTTNGLDKLILRNENNSGPDPEATTEHYLTRKNSEANSVNSIIEDINGHLWLATHKGLIEFDPVKGIQHTYTVFDGLKSNEFNPNSALKTSSGEIFLGSINGLNVFYPDSIRQSDYKPPVVITGFQVFNRNIPIGKDSPLKTSLATAKKIVLSYSQNVFSFQFAALDYNAAEANQYAYKMDGFDEDWIYSGTRRFVTYTNLYPGEYIFNVKATNSDGIWNNSPTQIAIIITPPFWETWWFRSLIILLFAGILYVLYRIRLSRMLEMERLRIKIASDLHDDIGSTLTRISLESELLNTDPDPLGRSEGLKRIGNMSREIISSMSDVVWSIDSRNDSVQNLIDRMKDFSFSLFSLKNRRVIFETVNLDMQKKLKVDVRQNIYLIFKEAMNNAARHSLSDQISVSLNNINGEFIMTIVDPEADFSPQKLTGHGLKNMKMRAKRIGGEIQFILEDGLKIVFRRREF